VNEAIEPLRAGGQIGKSLDAAVTLHVPGATPCGRSSTAISPPRCRDLHRFRREGWSATAEPGPRSVSVFAHVPSWGTSGARGAGAGCPRCQHSPMAEVCPRCAEAASASCFSTIPQDSPWIRQKKQTVQKEGARADTRKAPAPKAAPAPAPSAGKRPPMEKPSKKTALRDSILARKAAMKPIAFSLDEVRAIAKTVTAKAESTAKATKVVAKPSRRARRGPGEAGQAQPHQGRVARRHPRLQPEADEGGRGDRGAHVPRSSSATTSS
jgi:hypothetical protein